MFRLSGRARKILVAVLAVLVVVIAVGLAILPEIVRRVAVNQAPKLAGRVLSLDDVDLNLFTGHLALKGGKVFKPGVNERAVEFERLDVRLDYLPFLLRTVRVRELTLAGATLSVLRRGPAEFDFQDILERFGGAKKKSPDAAPSKKWTIVLDRVSVHRLTAMLRDVTTTPQSEWRIDDMNVEARGLTMGGDARPGTLETTLKLNGAPITVTSDSLALDPLAAAARVTVDGFDLKPLPPYLASAPAAPRAGRVTVAAALSIELAPGGLKRGTVRGDVKIAGLEILQTGRPDPFLTIPGVNVKITEADLVARAVTLSAVEIEGLALRAVRDAQKKIDLVALAERPDGGHAETAAGPASSPAPAGASPPAFKVKIERIALRNGGLTWRDEAVTPLTTLQITELSADVTDVTWPPTGPATFAVAMKPPKDGRLELKGSGVPAPLDVEVAISLRNGRIEPFQAYFAIPAQFAGSFNTESRNRVMLTDGRVEATSRGDNWIEKFTVTAPGEKTPMSRFERLRFDGIDFAWPKHARVAKITLRKPHTLIERDKDGQISLRKLFTPNGRAASAPEKPEPATKDASDPAKPIEPLKPGVVPIPVEIGTILVEDGYARFLDRTVDPVFSQELSRLAVMVEGLSSTPGRRARLSTQAVVGGTSAFDLHGEIAAIGEVYADLTGELRDFQLPSVNPYADPITAWFMKTGKLGIKMHVRIEKNQLTAQNEIEVKNLTVAPSRQDDEVKKKVGLPLGMIVALVTDQDNGIKVNVPLSGDVNKVRADPSDAIWTALKNAIVNIVGAPFRAIGRLGKGKGDTVEEPKVDAVTFAAGSAEVAPAMEQHLTKVADFLRTAPQIKLAMAPVAAPRDVESLRAQEVTLRIQRLQKERGIADFNAAVAAAFKEQLPEVTPPKSGEEQLAVLTEREPVPDARMQELQARRLAAVQEAFARTQGIPADRLIPGDARASDDAAGEGRVEFTITN